MILAMDSLDMSPKSQATKEKIDKLDLIKIKKRMFLKGHYQESEKTTLTMRETICKKKYLIKIEYPYP